MNFDRYMEQYDETLLAEPKPYDWDEREDAAEGD